MPKKKRLQTNKCNFTAVKSGVSHPYNSMGIHILADFFGVECRKQLLNETRQLTEVAMEAALLGRHRILKNLSYSFKPEGATIVLLLAESHLSIHTYPEHAFTSVDLYSCGRTAKPRVTIGFLLKSFKPKSWKIIQITRGNSNTEVFEIT